MYIYYNRPFNKFMRPAEVGLLPSKSIEEFMRKDIVKPLQRKSLYNPIDRPLIKTALLKKIYQKDNNIKIIISIK